MIHHSILDSDLYKFSVGQVFFSQFPRMYGEYKFINRGEAAFPVGFGDLLRAEIHRFSALTLRKDEFDWLRENCPFLSPTYLEWLRNFSFNKHEVDVQQHGDQLKIAVIGPLYRACLWEVPLMAMVSELHGMLTCKHEARDSDKKVVERAKLKSVMLDLAGVPWADFGTRRRFSQIIHHLVIEAVKDTKSFIGSSNLLMCKEYGLRPVGTMGHEGPMAMQGLFGFRHADEEWLEAWVKEYRGQLGICLPDTLTSMAFFDWFFDSKWGRLFDGVRQDSGKPETFANVLIDHYESYGIDPRTKKLIFSDGLTPDRLIELHKKFNDRIQVSGGIGTNFTNDVGVKPLNIVVKLTAVSPDGDRWFDVVKLSDVPGKAVGTPDAVKSAKFAFNIH